MFQGAFLSAAVAFINIHGTLAIKSSLEGNTEYFLRTASLQICYLG